MGAAIALRLAVYGGPGACARSCSRAQPGSPSAPDNMRPYALVGELLVRHPPIEARRLFDESETAIKLARLAPDNLASLRGFFSRAEPIAFGRLLTAIAADGPGVSENEMRHIAVPTLVLGHGRDLAHPIAGAELLARLIPNARLRIITPKAENRDAYKRDFRRCLSEFLEAMA